jgi:hypothetical protein
MYQQPQNPLLPVTVQDQIRLWELEKNRLKSREGSLSLYQRSPRHLRLPFRISLYRFRVSSRLRVRSELCEGAWRCIMGKHRQKVLFR